MTINPTIIRKNHWPSGDRKIILTFDDGPNPDKEISNRLLDVLCENKIKATFCYIGQNMEENPEIVKRAITEGHSIAYHSYSHMPWLLISGKYFKNDLLKSITVLKQIIGNGGYRPSYFRTPWGIVTPSINKILVKNKLNTAYINFFVNDAWSGPNSSNKKMDKIRKLLIHNNGGAIVLHENCHSFANAPKVDKSWLPEAVNNLVQWANNEGFCFSQYRQQG
jgi:peptidoglycan/xylan/chitin deacetylase (PgdA/CDA1 family)